MYLISSYKDTKSGMTAYKLQSRDEVYAIVRERGAKHAYSAVCQRLKYSSMSSCEKRKAYLSEHFALNTFYFIISHMREHKEEIP